MAELIDSVRLWVEGIIYALGYPGIALVILIENIVPPIPSELVLPLAGFLVVEGRMTFVGVVLASTIGSVLGALVLYAMGSQLGEPIIRRLLQRYGRYLGTHEQDLDRALQVFARRGDMIVFLGRLIPVVRSIISLPAGMHRMALGRFVLFTTLGSLIWNSALVYAGMLLGANWLLVLDVMKQYQRGALIVLALLGSLWMVRFLQQRKPWAARVQYGDTNQ